MKVNILNGKTRNNSEIPMETTETDFWDFYIKLLNCKTSHQLNDKEIMIMVYILCGEPRVSYFKGDRAQEIRDALRLTAPDLSRIKRSLVIKGFIKEDATEKANAVPIPSIVKFQQWVKNNKDITFIFPFVIND